MWLDEWRREQNREDGKTGKWINENKKELFSAVVLMTAVCSWKGESKWTIDEEEGALIRGLFYKLSCDSLLSSDSWLMTYDVGPVFTIINYLTHTLSTKDMSSAHCVSDSPWCWSCLSETQGKWGNSKCFVFQTWSSAFVICLYIERVYGLQIKW